MCILLQTDFQLMDSPNSAVQPWSTVTLLVASPAQTLAHVGAAKRSRYSPSEQRCPTTPPHIPRVCVLTHDRDVILDQEQGLLAALHQHGQSVRMLLSV